MQLFAFPGPITDCLCLDQVLVGNKCDMDESKRAVPTSKGQALADEFGIRFFETSAKNNSKVDEVCQSACISSCKEEPGNTGRAILLPCYMMFKSSAEEPL